MNINKKILSLCAWVWFDHGHYLRMGRLCPSKMDKIFNKIAHFLSWSELSVKLRKYENISSKFDRTECSLLSYFWSNWSLAWEFHWKTHNKNVLQHQRVFEVKIIILLMILSPRRSTSFILRWTDRDWELRFRQLFSSNLANVKQSRVNIKRSTTYFKSLLVFLSSP